MILDDINVFIIKNLAISQESIKFDFDSSEGQDVVLLTLYDTVPCDLSMRSNIKITFKFAQLQVARNLCFALYNLLFPQESFQKAIVINGKTMHVKLNQGPFYEGNDVSHRHEYILDISVIYNR